MATDILNVNQITVDPPIAYEAANDRQVMNGASFNEAQTSLAHGMTDILPTTHFLSIDRDKTYATVDYGFSGSPVITGIGKENLCGIGMPGLHLRGLLAVTAPGVQDPCMRLTAGKKNGTTFQAVADDETMFDFTNAGTVMAGIMGSGSIWTHAGLKIRDGACNHGLSAVMDTSEYFSIQQGPTGYSTRIIGISEYSGCTSAPPGLDIIGIVNVTDPDDNYPAVSIAGGKSNGTTGYTDLAADETVFSFKNHLNQVASIKGDGDISTIGSLTAATGFGCNGKAAQTAVSSGAAIAAYGAGANGLDSGANMAALHALVIKMRDALIANGTMT